MATPAISQPLTLSIRQDLNTNQICVTYGSKQYTVRILEQTGTNRHEVTGLRDWTGVTRIVLDYLREEVNQPFDFNRMKRAEIAFNGDVALNAATLFPNPKAPVITNIRWSQDSQQPMENVPLPSIQKLEVVDKLKKLGTELARYRPPVSTSAPQLQPQTRPTPSPHSQAGAALIHDAGGGGDCGPNSIAHQLALMGEAHRTPQQLRNEVFQYFNTDQVIRDPRLCGYVCQSLDEERAENQRFANATTVTGEQVARDLHEYRNATQLNLSAQESEARLRNILNYRKERLNTAGVWVDKDFFYILGQLGTPIGIIRRDGDRYAIEERFPPNQPIDRDRTVWIYYNGTRTSRGYHFQSFYRDRANFIEWRDQLLLEDRNRSIAHLCQQIQERRVRLLGDPQQRAEALTSITRNVTDFRAKHPDLFTRAINLMQAVNPALPFDATNFGGDEAHYEELLNNRYADIFTAQNLMNA